MTTCKICLFATLAISLNGLAAATTVSPSGLGAIRVKGYVGDRLDLMLKNHLAATDTDYITAPFREKTERRGWWQTEFWGKYMHAAVPFRAYARDSRLDANIEKGVDAILASQESSGYIGNYPEDLRCGEGWDVWGMKYTMLGLLHYYDGAPSSEKGRRALAAACRVCDYLIAELGPNGRRGKRLYQTGNWCGFASSSVLEPVVWLYNRTNEKRYLDFASYLVADMTEKEDGPRLLDLAVKGISVADRNGYGNVPEKGTQYVMKRNRRKAYEMMSCYQGLVEYALVTGRKDLLDAARMTGEQIVRDEINVAGGSASSEAWFHGSLKQHLPYTRLQETCVVTTWMRFCETLLRVTNDPKWADELEKSFYNIYLASLNRTADEFAAYTPLNGSRYRGHHHCYMHTNCCNANGPRGFLAFLRALIRGVDDTVYMNFYTSGSASVVLPKTGETVSFESYSPYPKTGYVRLLNHTEKANSFVLALRIPSWSERTRVRVNGQAIASPVKAGSYCRIDREWTIGDIVEIDFDMRARIHHLDHALAFTRGPIALARDTRFGDGPIDEVFRGNWKSQTNAPDFEPTRCPNEEMWMAFTASLPIGSHHENPEGATRSTVRFCDYASAADLWEPSNASRVWFPCEYGPEE